MAENNRRFTDVNEKLTEKTDTRPMNNLPNNGTMFLEPQNPTSNSNPNSLHKEKSTSFEIKSVVQSSRQADEGDDSTDEYEETFSDNVDSGINNSSNSLQINELDPDKFNTLTIQYQHLENGVGSLSLEYNNQENKSLEVPYINSHENEQFGISKTENTQFSKPLDQWQTRFKVVKIGSAEPFKRGRWSCMDFVDPPIPQETKQEIVQESGVLTEVTSTSYTSDAVSTTTNHTVKEVGTSPTSSTIESNILPSSCVNGGTSTQSSYRAPTPQLPLESQQQTIGFSSPDNAAQANHTVMFQQASTNTSQTVMSSTDIPISTANENGYSPPLLTASTMQTSYQSSAPTNIPNGFIVPLSQNNADHEPPQNSSQNSKSADLLKDSYPAFQALLEPLTMNMGTSNEDSESASGGTGAVALDNKIEQAMDLVKSHLMFAVREEVDVLKEKITELTERITQLEYENGVLRAHASPEVLSQLSGAPPTPCQAIPPSPGNPPSS